MSDWLHDRMLGYYPEVVKQLYEIQAIIDGEYPEFRLLTDEQIAAVQNNAYLVTMNEARIKQWEELLNIRVLPDSSIEERRNVIIARIRGNGKLNTESINTVVNAFTGGEATSRVENSVLYVEIRPARNDKEYKYENVRRELEKRKPAHLGLNVDRLYATWDNIKVEFLSWQSVQEHFATWEDVYYYVKVNRCNWNDLRRAMKTWKSVKSWFESWGNAYYYRTDQTYGE